MVVLGAGFVAYVAAPKNDKDIMVLMVLELLVGGFLLKILLSMLVPAQ